MSAKERAREKEDASAVGLLIIQSDPPREFRAVSYSVKSAGSNAGSEHGADAGEPSSARALREAWELASQRSQLANFAPHMLPSCLMFCKVLFS